MIARLVVCAFFGVLFLQAGLDKVTDWKGNLEWLTGHFANSPFGGKVPFLLGVVTLVELSAGLVSSFAVVMIAVGGPHEVGILGLALSLLALLMLFTGQRVAKDYAGAASLAVYLAVGLIGLALFNS